jgi:hypothetical protein
MSDRIESHYCGQRQPHDAHVWQTPQVYGSTQLIHSYQCAGYAPFVDDQDDEA